MKAAVVTAVLLVAVKTASAQPGMTQPAPLPAPVAVEQEEPLSETTAVALSIGGTVVPWVMLIAAGGDEDGATIGTIGAIGTFLGPSLGHWYAHDYATRGLGLRALGAGAALAGVMVALSECPLFSEEECHETATPAVLMIAGAGLYIGGTIDDIATAPRTVRDYNREHAMMVVPVVTPNSGGVAVVGTF